MIKKFSYILVLFALIISCKSEEKTEVQQQEQVAEQEQAKISSVGSTLLPDARKDLSDWLYFQMLQSKVNGYFKVTKSQALLNARELADLVKKTSDSIAIEKLDRPDIVTRFNVLQNHALRLDDMSTITSISEEEVMSEVDDILAAYASLYEKINVIYKIEAYENELDIVSEKPMVFEKSEIKSSGKKKVEKVSKETTLSKDKNPTQNKAKGAIKRIDKKSAKKEKQGLPLRKD